MKPNFIPQLIELYNDFREYIAWHNSRKLALEDDITPTFENFMKWIIWGYPKAPRYGVGSGGSGDMRSGGGGAPLPVAGNGQGGTARPNV